MFGINITKCYFMYIIDQNERETISYRNKTAIYYIYYELSRRKFLYSNYKEINKLEPNTLQLLEIQKPNLELIQKFNELEKSNDISEIKKYLLNKKRYKKGKEKEEDENEIKENKGNFKKKAKDIINNDNGYYTIPNIDFFKISEIYGTKDSKDKNSDSETKNKANKEIKIPPEWKSIFNNNFNFYKLIQEKLNSSNAIFELPVFYISEGKYIIIKENDDYSFYKTNTGGKLKNVELHDVYNSFNPFYNSTKRKYLNAYFLSS